MTRNSEMNPAYGVNPAGPVNGAGTADRHDPWRSHLVRIQRMTHETPGVATYDLVLQDASAAAQFRFHPGQFNMLYVPGVGEIAISISGDPQQAEVLTHTVREAGNVTQALSRLPAGATLGLRGPFGSAWPVSGGEGREIILVAGGIGLAPLRPVILALLSEPQRYGRLNLLYGSRDPDSLLYAHDYETWRQRGLNLLTTTDRAPHGWNGSVGVVTMLLERLPIADPANTLLMTCGPEVMMWYTIQTALGRGIAAESIYVSLERNMNCAIGLCGHCQLGPEFLCKDGPVFRYDRVASILKVDEL